MHLLCRVTRFERSVSPATQRGVLGISSSLKATTPTLSGATLVDVRAGRQGCYDRLVLDMTGNVGGYRVSYVDKVSQPGSGFTVPVRGGARLSVNADAPADRLKKCTYPNAEMVNVSQYQTFRQVAWAGSF